MDKEKRVNLLPVHLAIQRELAYREKVAKARFHQDADFIKKLLLLQLGLSVPIDKYASGGVSSKLPKATDLQNSEDVGANSATFMALCFSGVGRITSQCFSKTEVIIKPSPQPSLITSSGLVQVPFSSPSPMPSTNPNSILSVSSNLVQLPSSSKSSRSASAPWWAPSLGLRQPEGKFPSSSLGSSVVSNPPYQVPCSNQNTRPSPSPSQFPRPRSGPGPRRSETGTKRQATNSYLKSLTPRQPRPFLSSCIIVDQAGNFFCKACQVPCSGAVPLKQHLKGHKHRAKMKWLQLSKKDGGEKKDQCTSCDLCQIWCTDEKTLELHLNGQKHRAKQREMEQGQDSSVGEKAIEQPWCELCQIWCTNEESFQQHLQGQKHVTRLKRWPVG